MRQYILIIFDQTDLSMDSNQKKIQRCNFLAQFGTVNRVLSEPCIPHSVGFILKRIAMLHVTDLTFLSIADANLRSDIKHLRYMF